MFIKAFSQKILDCVSISLLKSPVRSVNGYMDMIRERLAAVECRGLLPDSFGLTVVSKFLKGEGGLSEFAGA